MNLQPLLPQYCPHCGRLTLRHPLALLDCKNGPLVEHPCKRHQGKPILEQVPAWSVPHGNLTFHPKTATQQRKPRDPQWGLVLLVGDDEAQVLELSNHLLFVKTKFPLSKLKPGQLLNLASCKRIGQDRFRLEAFAPVRVSETWDGLIRMPEEFYRVTLASGNEAQLERLAESLVQLCLGQGILPLALTVKAVEPGENVIYGRQLDLDPNQNLLEALAQYPLPPQVKLSINQIKP